MLITLTVGRKSVSVHSPPSRRADCLPERRRPGEHRQGRETAWTHIDDRAVRGVHQHVPYSIEPSTDTRGEPQKRVR